MFVHCFDSGKLLCFLVWNDVIPTPIPIANALQRCYLVLYRVVSKSYDVTGGR